MKNNPIGFNNSRNWVKCKSLLCRLRPNYPYKIEKELPENVDKHYSTVYPLEKPKSTGWLLEYKANPITNRPQKVTHQFSLK